MNQLNNIFYSNQLDEKNFDKLKSSHKKQASLIHLSQVKFYPIFNKNSIRKNPWFCRSALF
jgi:hypothetical protein